MSERREAAREAAREASEAREAERQTREREWEIEQARWTMIGGTQPLSGLRNAVQDFSQIRALLPKMIDNDVLAFFQGYEHTLLCNDVDRFLWIKLLTAQLSSKAIGAFSRLSAEDKLDYGVVKRTILAYYRLDAQAYLKVFRKICRRGNETYKMALSRMRNALSDFCESKKIDTFEGLFDSVLTDSFLTPLLMTSDVSCGLRSQSRLLNAANMQTCLSRYHRLGLVSRDIKIKHLSKCLRTST